MVIASVSALHAHSCLRMLDFGVRNALEIFGASLGKYVCGVGLGPLAVGKASMWDDCLLVSLRYLACGPSELFALQRHGSLGRMSCEPSSC